MTLTQRLDELVRACFTGIWIQSHEHQDAVAEIGVLCQREDWRMVLWDVDQGLSGQDAQANASDPLSAVRALGSIAGSDEAGTTLLVLQNYHRFLGSAEIVQAVSRAVIDGKLHRTFVVVLSPVIQLPVELEKLFVIIDHEPPTREQLDVLARSIATEEGELPQESEMDRVLDAAVGLTRYEAEAAFSLSLVRHGCIRPDTIWEFKTQTLKKSGLLSLYRGEENFSNLGGLSALKAFTRRALLRSPRVAASAKARGVLLLSPPGCGKSQFCKTLGKEVGRPVLILDVGSLMGSLVGQSEERTRHALRTIDAMAPCVAMLDEVDKAFAGVGGSGQNDSGVSARMFGTFLSWLNDHESDVFVVCTANDVTKLPPEFSRSERFDGVFFLDLPQREQKDAIWQMYVTYFGVDADQQRPRDDDWTGAEIRSCCRLAALLDLPLAEAAKNVVPVAVTSAESVTRLRQWASGRCLDADSGGIYSGAKPAGKQRRRVTRGEPSEN
ncbi:AAA family ATPase [Candidatus Laterigemmans baculatus]|uniref:AAA family ATPase n=1 Tax=Candidatus Laterigemmans baculatus TaxID=2770505 RepID=UPI0013DBB8B0|nr:AAA family ATPase [Candidatus Laterigemmans baculatus]